MLNKPSNLRAPYNSNVYENDKFIICDNGSSELIVMLKDFSNVSIRITPHSHSLDGYISVVSQSRQLWLYHINGLNGVRTAS